LWQLNTSDSVVGEFNKIFTAESMRFSEMVEE